jgi:hypothetical protein
MAKGKNKRRLEPFDVTEFLRSTDADLKSALTSMLGGTPEASGKPLPAFGEARASGITASPAVMAATSNGKKIYACLQAQEGHSRIEHAVYLILWKNGSAQPDGSRFSRLGLARIAAEVNVHERNIGAIIRRLIHKQSIEILRKEASELRTARTYRVFDDEAILKRRKRAGLEWVVRGRGVEFVNPETALPLYRETARCKAITAGDAVTS